jgi:hypothetical protein
MHRYQLPLKMSGKFGELQAVPGQSAQHVVAIRRALRGKLQVKQTDIPTGYLDAFVPKAGGPARYVVESIKRSGVASKLSQEYCRPPDRLHDVQAPVRL